MEDKDRLCNISQSRSIKEVAEFWETHDAADYDDQTYKVTMEFELQTRHHYVAIDPELLARLRKLAQARGISLESLANLWLQERISAAENQISS